MRAGPRTIRKGFGVALLVTAGVAVAIGFETKTSAAADADLFGFQATVQPSPLSTALSSSVGYNLASEVCSLGSVPSPESTQLPGYMDVTSVSTGPCTVSGTGSLTVVFCSTGSVDAQWQFGEPGGNTAEFDAQGVMVGGVAVLAAPPVPQLGMSYRDPAGGTTSGAASGVALFLPSGTDTCTSPSFIGRLTAAIVGVQ